MASGISHEMNNPLTIVYGNACKLIILNNSYDALKTKTKAVVGLSISNGLAESHHGKLFLDVEAPQTRFILSLPKHQQSFLI